MLRVVFICLRYHHQGFESAGFATGIGSLTYTKKNAYIMYTPSAGGRRTYQSDRHACICFCNISRLRQRSDISDSHSFARRVYLFRISPSGLRIGSLCDNRPISLLSHFSRFEVSDSRPFARRCAPSNGVPCLCLSQEPEKIGSHICTKQERIHVVYVSYWRSSHLSVGPARMHMLLSHIPFTSAVRHKRFAQFCASLPLLQNWLSAYPRACPR